MNTLIFVVFLGQIPSMPQRSSLLYVCIHSVNVRYKKLSIKKALESITQNDLSG